MFSYLSILLLQLALRTVASPTVRNNGLIAFPLTKGRNISDSLLARRGGASGMSARAINSIGLQNVKRAYWLAPVNFGTSQTECQSDILVQYKFCP